MADKRKESRFLIEPLGEKHNRAAFSCGVEALDAYLHKQAGQDARKRAAVPFVATEDVLTIAGYYTLSQYAIRLDAIPEEVAKKLPKYPTVSATLLGRLAVSSEFRGQGLGESLLMDALHRSLESSKQIASTGVIVDAKDGSATAFYRKYGFIELPKIEKRLFLPMGTVEQLFRTNNGWNHHITGIPPQHPNCGTTLDESVRLSGEVCKPREPRGSPNSNVVSFGLRKTSVLEPSLGQQRLRHGELMQERSSEGVAHFQGRAVLEFERFRSGAWRESQTRFEPQVAGSDGLQNYLRFSRDGNPEQSPESAIVRFQSRKTTLRSELLMWMPPLYLMKPSFLNLFMKTFIRERVVPTISASISCDTFGSNF